MSRQTIAIATILAMSGILASAKKKAPPTPTQADVIRGCIAVRDIVFQRGAFLRAPLISGYIENTCGRSALVGVDVLFFDNRGLQVAEAFPSELVSVGGLAFKIAALDVSGQPVYFVSSGVVSEVYARLPQ